MAKGVAQREKNAPGFVSLGFPVPFGVTRARTQMRFTAVCLRRACVCVCAACVSCHSSITRSQPSPRRSHPHTAAKIRGVTPHRLFALGFFVWFFHFVRDFVRTHIGCFLFWCVSPVGSVPTCHHRTRVCYPLPPAVCYAVEKTSRKKRRGGGAFTRKRTSLPQQQKKDHNGICLQQNPIKRENKEGNFSYRTHSLGGGLVFLGGALKPHALVSLLRFEYEALSLLSEQKRKIRERPWRCAFDVTRPGDHVSSQKSPLRLEREETEGEEGK